MSSWTGTSKFDCDKDDYYMDYPCPTHEVELVVLGTVHAFQLKLDGEIIHQGSFDQLNAIHEVIVQAKEEYL